MINGEILKLIFMFPTFLYFTSAGVGIISRRGKITQSTEEMDFTSSMMAQSLILNLLNGMIISFGIGQIAFGIAVTIAGTMISVFGLSSAFTETDAVKELFLSISSIIVVGEVLDFATYSYIAAAALIIVLVSLLLYYTIRISGEFETPAL